MAGPFEHAIRTHLRSGSKLTTPAQGKPFTLALVDDRGIVMLLGAQQAQTRFSWAAIEGVRGVLAAGMWVEIGSSYSTTSRPGTLDAYLKQHVRRATAGWMAAVLEAANLVDIDRRPPARLRLRAEQTPGPSTSS